MDLIKKNNYFTFFNFEKDKLNSNKIRRAIDVI